MTDSYQCPACGGIKFDILARPAVPSRPTWFGFGKPTDAKPERLELTCLTCLFRHDAPHGIKVKIK